MSIQNDLATNSRTHQEIADKHGVSRSRVTQIANNINTRADMVVLSSAQWSKVVHHCKSNKLTITEASRKYGVSRSSIYRHLRAYEEEKTNT